VAICVISWLKKLPAAEGGLAKKIRVYLPLPAGRSVRSVAKKTAKRFSNF
jgi:hypothetical protein